jgi:hypothetical protein
MRVAKGRLVLDRDVMEWVQATLALPGLRMAPLEPAVAVASTRLPGELHGDPADRLIVATARHLGATLVTADAALLAYARLGHVQALPAGGQDDAQGGRARCAMGSFNFRPSGLKIKDLTPNSAFPFSGTPAPPASPSGPATTSPGRRPASDEAARPPSPRWT